MRVSGFGSICVCAAFTLMLCKCLKTAYFLYNFDLPLLVLKELKKILPLDHDNPAIFVSWNVVNVQSFIEKLQWFRRPYITPFVIPYLLNVDKL